MTNAVSLAQQASIGVSQGFKNRIINGAMVIAQRGTGTTSTAFVNQVDQFQVASNSSATFTFGQSSTAPTGFIKSALNTNTSATTLTGTNYYSIRNVIEGLNIADLGWGTANAKTVTLSFLVYSSLTGSFGGSVFNGSVNYSYPFLYTISSANTWTQINVTIAGPTAGTWATDNNAGMYIEWSLGCGSTYLGTAGAWAASRFQGATGQVQLSQTNGATFYITGVQLEVGSTATSFDYLDYGRSLIQCQRYCIRFSADANNTNTKFGLAFSTSAAEARCVMPFPVKMRSYPSLTTTSTASQYGINYYAGGDGTCNAVPTINVNTGTLVGCTEWSLGSGMTGGQAVMPQANGNNTAYLLFSAEL